LKKKEIITLTIAITIIAVSVYFALQLLFPKNTPTETVRESEQIETVPGEIDRNTLERVDNLSDYGMPTLSGIGKRDLFSGF